ncbi:hypothetical protein HD554DRAFT_2040622 [Boletus coccyginus]|nr:hypothetical protein HD554DRAFT_2040622 [Boletus coccyginus]
MYMCSCTTCDELIVFSVRDRRHKILLSYIPPTRAECIMISSLDDELRRLDSKSTFWGSNTLDNSRYPSIVSVYLRGRAPRFGTEPFLFKVQTAANGDAIYRHVHSCLLRARSESSGWKASSQKTQGRRVVARRGESYRTSRTFGGVAGGRKVASNARVAREPGVVDLFPHSADHFNGVGIVTFLGVSTSVPKRDALDSVPAVHLVGTKFQPVRGKRVIGVNDKARRTAVGQQLRIPIIGSGEREDVLGQLKFEDTTYRRPRPQRDKGTSRTNVPGSQGRSGP